MRVVREVCSEGVEACGEGDEEEVCDEGEGEVGVARCVRRVMRRRCVMRV